MVPKILVDVNVCLDVLLDRKPFVEFSGQIFEWGEKGKIKLFISGLSFDTLFYVMRPEMGANKSTKLLSLLLHHITIAEVNHTVVKQALKASWNDLEDALQYYSGKEAGCSYLVTRNPKDYKNRGKEIVVMTPKEFLEKSI